MLNFDQFLNEGKNPKDLQFWVDMDGVLADFDQKMWENPKFEEAMRKLAEYAREKFNLNVEKADDAREFLKHTNDPTLKKLYNDVRSLIHETAGSPGFFMSLNKMSEDVVDILTTAKEISGKLPHILTAPIDNKQSTIDDKREWMETHFQGLYDKFIADPKKYLYAKSKNDVLIDDRLKNVIPFKKAGGTTILHTSVEDTLKKMKAL